MIIPDQFKQRGIYFVLLEKEGKRPFEKSWQKKQLEYDSPSLVEHISKEGNYGIRGGGERKLIIVDFDNEKVQEDAIKKLPKTFTVKTGSGMMHKYYYTDDNKSFKIFDEDINTLADIQAEGKQVVGANSIHPNGNRYEVTEDKPIAFIPYSELKAIMMSYDRKPRREVQEIMPISKVQGDNFLDDLIGRMGVSHVLSHIGIDTSKNPTDCPLHSSKGGKCFGFTNETWHCFHCEEKGNILSLVRMWKGCETKEAIEILAEIGGMTTELGESRKEYAKQNTVEKKEQSIFTRRGQVEEFWNRQPFFYDKAKLFWLWNKEEYRWVLSDEVDFCNLIYDTLGVDTINSKAKNELVEGFKQIGRKHRPKDIGKSWIQFKDKIYDVKTGEVFKATPEYFATNPIPWKVGEEESTPTMDKLFVEWVGEEYKQTLYEILAYNVISDKFMQRIIALVGGGSNGKGTYSKLNYKFIGEDNTVSSEIKALSEDKFEPAILHKKLLCIMGEVSSNDLKNTNMLKKLGGEDKISFQFKGKTPFSEDNTATCMCLTNSLPLTPDKSIGFYRKWLIIDFPNQFKQISENPIEKIPEVEFENLAKKCLGILKELYLKPQFTNEGTFEEREHRYEERSNPIVRFIDEKCEEDAEISIPLKKFSNVCNEYFKSKHLRIMSVRQVSKILRDEGFEIGSRTIDGISRKMILNLTLKTTKTTKTTEELSRMLRIETNSKHGSFSSFDSSGNIIR